MGTIYKNAKSDQLLPAKLTMPVSASVAERDRLLRLMDESRRSPVVWIAAPAGAGKTTLVSSYLTRRQVGAVWYQADESDQDVASLFYYLALAVDSNEKDDRPLPLLTAEYRDGISVFAANFFRTLYERIGVDKILVFDNFQLLSENETAIEIFRIAFEQIPPGVNVVVISREMPSPALARLRVAKAVSLITNHDLQLTVPECEAVIQLRSPEAKQVLTAADVHRYTHGWMAGVVLLMEYRLSDGDATSRPEHANERAVFDYFASEILRRSSVQIREFLLATAWLPTITPEAAIELTGGESCEIILEDLLRRNFFTSKRSDGAYEYHPLFREFLKNQSQRTLPSEALSRLRVRSAELAIKSGNIEEGMSLLLEAGAFGHAAANLRIHAPNLLRQGRHRTLERWLTEVPPEVMKINSWLLYFLGTSRVAITPRLARNDLVEAFALFERENESSGVLLSWSRIIESYIAEMNDFTEMIEWLQRYPALQQRCANVSSNIQNVCLFMYIVGLTNADWSEKALPVYVESAQRIIDSETRPERKAAYIALLIPYLIWRGEDNVVGSLLERLDASATTQSTAVKLDLFIWRTLFEACVGNGDASLSTAQQGFELAELSGIHRGDSQLAGYAILGQLAIGHTVRARSMLDRLLQMPPTGLVGEAILCHYSSIVAMHEGRLQRAITDAERAVKLADTGSLALGSVSYRIALASIYANCGRVDSAVDLLKVARPLAAAMGSNRFLSFSDFCSAAVSLAQGNSQEALSFLRSALALGEQGGFVTAAYFPRELASRLYNLALDEDICVEYVKSTILTMHLLPPPDDVAEKWPWRVKIFAFGRFVVVKDEMALRFNGKAQKKPLELLRAIIAFGGREVGMNRLAQILWPDSDGDIARSTLRTTLMRLRRLVGEEVVIQQGNYLSINSEYCWLDLWAFERLCDRHVDSVESALRTEQVLRLYAGIFLAEDDEPWISNQRERLRSKALRAIVDSGQWLEAHNRLTAAITTYQKGIEVDPLAEGIYRRLMHCYVRSNRRAEALALYQRCRAMLSRSLRIEPAAETKSLYQEIQRETL